MKRWLQVAAMVICLLFSAAFGEEKTGNVIVYFQDGAMVLLPSDIANDDQKVADYCHRYFPGRMYAKDPSAFMYAAVLSEKWVAEQYGEGSAMSVTLKKLGVFTSIVTTAKGEELTVPTAELTIRGFEDKVHHVAVISAPRTGSASMREKASGSGKAVANCAAGRIVPVLECTNASYAKIIYDGVEGYIRMDCLVFQDTSKAPVGTGAVDGKSGVIVRNTASKSTSQVAEVPAGTVLSVYGEEGSWYLVEGDGWYGYISRQNLKLSEE